MTGFVLGQSIHRHVPSVFAQGIDAGSSRMQRLSAVSSTIQGSGKRREADRASPGQPRPGESAPESLAPIASDQISRPGQDPRKSPSASSRAARSRRLMFAKGQLDQVGRIVAAA